MAIQFPKGKYISMVKVGEKGQIVIPKGARDLFSIQPETICCCLPTKKRALRSFRRNRSIRPRRCLHWERK